MFPIVTEAINVTINNKETLETATELLSKLNRLNDKIIEEKEKVTKPLNEALKAERSRWKPIEVQHQQAIDHLRAEMSRYQTEEIKRQGEEKAKIASRIGEGKGKLKLDTAVKKMEEIEKPETSVTTATGMIKFREDKVLKVTNLSSIPKKYFILNESLVLSDLKAGVAIPGAELDIKMVPLNFR